MEKKCIQFLIKNIILVLFLLTGHQFFSQDLIIDKSGEKVICNITNITSDTIYLNKTVKNEIVKTFLHRQNVQSFKFFLIDEIKKDKDSSYYYKLVLRDGTSLAGKVIETGDIKIKFDDNNLGIIWLNAFSVNNFKKESNSALYFVNLNDGNKLYGKIIERRKHEIELETKTIGIVTVPIANIKSMDIVEEEKVENDENWFPNPNNTRYYFAPSAFNLKRGEAYYQNVYFIVNSANYGISDHFSIGGGIIIPFALYVTPKFNFKITEKFYAGAGILLGMMPETSAVGIAYGLTTFGTSEHNFTVGAGWGFFEDEFSERPIITLNGMTRISKRVALVSENWAIPSTEYEYDDIYWEAPPDEIKTYNLFFSYGLRIMWEKITIDIALVNNKDIFEFMPLGLPYVDFVYKFGK